jgi:hypothetical protein
VNTKLQACVLVCCEPGVSVSQQAPEANSEIVDYKIVERPIRVAVPPREEHADLVADLCACMS